MEFEGKIGKEQIKELYPREVSNLWTNLQIEIQELNILFNKNIQLTINLG